MNRYDEEKLAKQAEVYRKGPEVAQNTQDYSPPVGNSLNPAPMPIKDEVRMALFERAHDLEREARALRRLAEVVSVFTLHDYEVLSLIRTKFRV